LLGGGRRGALTSGGGKRHVLFQSPTKKKRRRIERALKRVHKRPPAHKKKRKTISQRSIRRRKGTSVKGRTAGNRKKRQRGEEDITVLTGGALWKTGYLTREAPGSLKKRKSRRTPVIYRKDSASRESPKPRCAPRRTSREDLKRKSSVKRKGFSPT